MVLRDLGAHGGGEVPPFPLRGDLMPRGSYMIGEIDEGDSDGGFESGGGD